MTVGYWRYGVLLPLVQLAVGCSPASSDGNSVANGADTTGATQPVNADSAAPVSADGKLVVAFGDSLYAGYSLDAGQGFAPALERALKRRGGIDARVFNAGVSGDTSAAGLARLDFVLDGLQRKPDLVIVGLGGNDMLRGLSPETTRTNIDAILSRLKARSIPAMLTGMMASPNMGPDYAAGFNSIYPNLARKYRVPLYPFFLDGVIGQRGMLLPDGIHPNAAGVDRIVGRVAPMVEDSL